MSRWSLTPPLPGESSQDILQRLVTDLNLILAEQEQDSLQIRGDGGYTAAMKGTLDMQGNILKGLPARPQSDDEATSLRYAKSGNLLYSDSDVFVTNRRIRHANARSDDESMTLEQVRRLIAQNNLAAVPFITMLASDLLTNERVLTGSSTLTVTDGGANTTATLSIPTTVLTSGTYTPTLTNTTNISGSTAFACNYMRVLDKCIVSGKYNADPVAAIASLMHISLPIASNLGSQQQLGGVAFNGQVFGEGASIVGDAATNDATVYWIATNTASQAYSFIFMYHII